jgi:uncharacterized membrane protein (UPF0127 family)
MMAQRKSRKSKRQGKTPAMFDRRRRSRFVLAILGVSLIVVITFVMSRPRQEGSFTPQGDSANDVRDNISLPGNIEFEKEGELTFLTSGGIELSTLDIEIADSRLETTQGLMYRTQLGPDEGMLFIFPFEGPRSFWMKNTQIPLDIVFVNANLRIVTIRNDAVPFDESSYASTEPAKFVVEVNAGYAKKHGIEVGDKIKWTAALE